MGRSGQVPEVARGTWQVTLQIAGHTVAGSRQGVHTPRSSAWWPCGWSAAPQSDAPPCGRCGRLGYLVGTWIWR